jgi:predicted nucleotidyltransferase
MDRKKSIINGLIAFKNETSKDVPIDKLIFFGSRASGKPKKHSDIDLIIVSKRFNGLKFRRRPLLLYKHWKLDYPVDFLCYTPSEFKKKSREISIVRKAVQTGVAIS